MNALLKQLDFELTRFEASKQSIESVFIGGGTPSTVPPELYAPVFKRLQSYFKEGIEITSEANPNSATLSWLQGMYDLGVNRISFGVQSFNDTKLKRLNRAHNSEQAKKAITQAAAIGYKNLSLDLIYGVADDTKSLLDYDLNTAFSLPINHLSAYALTIEEGTVFQKTPQMSQERLNITRWLFETIGSHGFKQYEISNFGRYQSQHNIGYWKHKEYIGLGCGAVGYFQQTRYYPTTSLEHYIENPLAVSQEKLSPEDIKIEKIFLGLRSCVGIDKSILSAKERSQCDLLVREYQLTCKDNHYYNTEYLLSDELALFITA